MNNEYKEISINVRKNQPPGPSWSSTERKGATDYRREDGFIYREEFMS
jgi:hypothetical protein